MPDKLQDLPDSDSAQRILEFSQGFVAARALHAAVQLQVFTHIAAGHTTAETVAEAEGASSRGTRMLLDALTGLELLIKSGGGYELAPASRQFLVKTSPDYMGQIMETDHIWSGWSALPETVRTGQPHQRMEQQAKAEEFFSLLVRTLHIVSREPARKAAEVLNPEKKALEVLEVASGSGVWSIPYAEQNAETKVLAQDFSGMLELTREYAERHGVANQYDYLPGDLKAADYGSERFDLAVLGNILHSEGEASSRDLLRRLSKALRPGGRVVIIEDIPNDERTGPPHSLLFALNMLVNSTDGDTFTLAQMNAWLQEAGFMEAETAEIGRHSPLVSATKK